MKNACIKLMVIGLVATGLFVGCGGDDSKPAAEETQAKATLPAGLIVDVAPTVEKDIAQVKASAKKGDTVVLKGRIGGSKKPFVSKWATFTIVDLKHPSVCLAGKCGCDTPWDYCCGGNDKMKYMATIQVADANGKPLPGSLRGVSGLDRLGIATVEGTVAQINGNTLIVNAVKIYNEPYQAQHKPAATCNGCAH